MNKSVAKLLFTLCVITLSAIITTTGCSCGNVGGGGNNNSGGGNGGGDGNGGGGNNAGSEATFGKMKFTMADTTSAKINAGGNEIIIKADQFPTTKAGEATANFKAVLTAIEGDNTKARKIFTVSLTGTTGGFLLVKGGESEVGEFSLPGFKTPWTDDDSYNKGIHVLPPSTEGLKIYSVFAEKTIPNAGNTASIFAFTPTTGTNGTQPIFYCVAHAPKYTDTADATASTTTFEGGQNADCYISSVGDAALGTGTEWLTATASISYKQSFQVTFAGIGTDGKAISAIGLTSSDAVAKVNALEDGVLPAEMKEITNANPDKFASRAMTLKIVNNQLFADTTGYDNSGGNGVSEATFGKMKFAMDDTTSAKINAAGDGIIIKADQFPTTAAGTANDHFGTVIAAIQGDTPITKAKKIFTVSLTGTTGGLLLVKGGESEVRQFSTPASAAWKGDETDDKGIHVLTPTTTDGLKIYSVFADKGPRTGASDGIFAFAVEGNTQPIFYCVATASEVVNFTDPTDKLTSGQNADCYISSVGDAATSEAWVTAATANFKKSFQVTFAGIGTDDKAISEIGLDGSTPEERVDAFKNDGITTVQMAAMAAKNSGRKVMKLKIVNATTFATTTGYNGSGGNTLKDPTPTATLELVPVEKDDPDDRDWVRIDKAANTVYINAHELSEKTVPKASTNDNERNWNSLGYIPKEGGGFNWNYLQVFNIKYPGNEASMFFVSRTNVTINTLATKAINESCSTSESADTTLAQSPTGAHCRSLSGSEGGKVIEYVDLLGTVFEKKTGPDDDARGLLACYSGLKKSVVDNEGTTNYAVIGDETKFNELSYTTCAIGVVNSGGAHATKEIDDDWVGRIQDNLTDKTTEIDLYVIGVNISDKTFKETVVTEGGTTKTIPGFFGGTWEQFKKPIDNATFKNMLRNNEWGELTFKVKIVHSWDF